MFHNAYFFTTDAGYDAMLHMRYSKIISHEFRIPSFQETRENYNPPAFYLISGLIGRIVSTFLNQDFFSSLKAWQYLSVLLATLSLYLWYKISLKLFSKNQLLSFSFVALIFSLPVFQKTIVMFSIETFFLFLTSLIFYYLAFHFLPKPSYKTTTILSLLVSLILLTRMSGVVIFLTIVFVFFGLLIIKKITLKKLILYLGLLLTIVFLSTSWFYIGRRDQDIYGVGEGGQPDKPFFQRQPLLFYTDVPFKFMMTYPVRLHEPLNKLVPIYYSEFWGDFWNYYPQRRFGYPISIIRKNRYFSPPKRVANLALQNQINLLPTLIMIAGFSYFAFKNFYTTFTKPDQKWLIESSFIVLSIFTWLGFLALLTKYPSWKGDSIKASYMLYNLPIFVYFSLSFLVIKLKSKIFLVPIVIWLLIATVINLYWGWF